MQTNLHILHHSFFLPAPKPRLRRGRNGKRDESISTLVPDLRRNTTLNMTDYLYRRSFGLKSSKGLY